MLAGPLAILSDPAEHALVNVVWSPDMLEMALRVCERALLAAFSDFGDLESFESFNFTMKDDVVDGLVVVR